MRTESQMLTISQQEFADTIWPLPRPVGRYRGLAGSRQEPAQARVRLPAAADEDGIDLGRFMFDKIMPLMDAVEGYDLFDKMKVQKVVFKP